MALQRKLSIGASGDPLEREADDVADQVLAGPPARHVSRASPRIQRLSSAASDHAGEAPASVDATLRRSGAPLGAALRQDMEGRFGHDFSHVRVHTEADAARSAQDVSASAYTVGNHIVFGAGQYAPASHAGQHLIAHELTHVVQQGGGAAGTGATGIGRAPANTLSRKVILKGTELDHKARAAFLKTHKLNIRDRASAVMEDMADAGDAFDFATDAELEGEIVKRTSTVAHEIQSQTPVKVGDNAYLSAFGYPFTGDAILYGPRVNFAARDYWTPGVIDNYSVRTDKVKNKQLRDSPRYERCKVYGDKCGDYWWTLTKKGETEPYKALNTLFKPQPAHKRTLFHCDYLLSTVNFLSFADSIGEAEFNKRVAAFGPSNLVLNWNGFNDLAAQSVQRDSATGEAPADATKRTAIPGLGSLQSVQPSSEKDLVLGDHVVFSNHPAYDAINDNIGNAWRLENAILVRRDKGSDVFLGHGSGYKTVAEMQAKLAEEYNDVAKIALAIAKRTSSKNATEQSKAKAEMASRFPNVKLVGAGWRVQGTDMCKHPVDIELRTIKSSEVLGLKSFCDVTKMGWVQRPIESAK